MKATNEGMAKQQHHSLPWVCFTRSRRPARLSLRAHRGSYHTKLKLCCRSSRYPPTTVVLGRQSAINSLHPKPASFLRSAAVSTPSDANVKSFAVRKQRWKRSRGIRPRVSTGPGAGWFQEQAEVQGCAGESCPRSPPCRAQHGPRGQPPCSAPAASLTKTGQKLLSTGHSCVC